MDLIKSSKQSEGSQWNIGKVKLKSRRTKCEYGSNKQSKFTPNTTGQRATISWEKKKVKINNKWKYMFENQSHDFPLYGSKKNWLGAFPFMKDM